MTGLDPRIAFNPTRMTQPSQAAGPDQIQIQDPAALTIGLSSETRPEVDSILEKGESTITIVTGLIALVNERHIVEIWAQADSMTRVIMLVGLVETATQQEEDFNADL